MKKVLAICLMMVMVLSVSVSVFAAPGKFVSSPSGNPAPIVIDFDPSNEKCTAKLVITPYGDRDELPYALRAMIESAYKDIENYKDLTRLNADLAKLAANKNIEGKNLAVSDLFDIHVVGCDYHDEHVGFDVTLDADTLNRFVALLHMNKNGAWELVADAKVINNGDHLAFSVDSFSPFAIVVDTTKGAASAPDTSDNSMIYVYAIIMAVSAVAIIAIAVIRKKSRA